MAVVAEWGPQKTHRGRSQGAPSMALAAELEKDYNVRRRKATIPFPSSPAPVVTIRASIPDDKWQSGDGRRDPQCALRARRME